MNLTDHFTLQELTRSATATRHGIANVPNAAELKNLTRVAEMLELIRRAWGKPIIVTSGFRCKALNEIVKGSPRSQHVTGSAADIRTLSDLPSDNHQLFEMIEMMVYAGEIEVGQLIDEYGYDWVHISLPNGQKKNQILHLK